MRYYFFCSALALFSCGTPIAVCGDGVVSTGEACDDGNTNNSDGCRADCFGAELCGDFLLDEGEVCDDGNQDSGDGCTEDCSRREVCGDSILDAGEECDDGNNIDADGCEADCSNPACQNDILDPGETCTGFANDSRLDALPFALKLADVNNDGLTDLISTNAGQAVRHTPPVLEGTVSVLFGEGNGKFSGRTNYAVHRAPIAFLVRDLTGDSFADIAVINKDSDALSVLLNDGEGSFLPEQEYETGAQPAALAAFDRDNDGDLDLVTADTIDGQVSIFLNQGADFIFSETIAVSGFPRSVTTGDFDQDGAQDLAVARLNDQRISTLLQRNNTWEERELDAAGFPIDLKSLDMDGDGSLDLITSYASTHEVGVYFGDNTGDFPEERRFATGDNPGELDLGDVNQDLRPDIVVLNKGDNNASALLSEGGRSFLPEKRVEDLVLFSSFALGDINADGRLDLSMGVNLSSFGRTFFGNGDGTFQTSPSLITPEAPIQIVPVDLDGDSLLDVAALTAQGVSLYSNDGGARLSHAADVATSNATGITALLGATVKLAVTSADGLIFMVDGSQQAQSISIGGAPTKIIASDITGDALEELLVFDASTNELRVFTQETGALVEQTSITIGEELLGLSSSDADEDGNQDIVALTASAAHLFFGDGAGLFTQESVALSAAPVAHQFVDGVLYVLAPDSLSAITQAQPRQLSMQTSALPGDWSSLGAADVNIDGVAELLLSDATSDEVLALSQGDLSLVQRFASGDPAQLVTVDLTSDTLIDLLVMEPLQNRFRIFFSNP